MLSALLSLSRSASRVPSLSWVCHEGPHGGVLDVLLPQAQRECAGFGAPHAGGDAERFNLQALQVRVGGNPNGGLANKRHQMSEPRFLAAGGDLW